MPATRESWENPEAIRRAPRLEDVLGEVLRSYPLGFCADPADEEVEREVLDEEIFSGLVAV